MIKLKTILSEGLLNEVLPLNLAKKYTSIKRNPAITKRLETIFKKLAELPGATTSKRMQRVFIPFDKKGSVDIESEVRDRIEVELIQKGYTLIDYKVGTVRDPYNRVIKLGKALTKLKRPDLLNLFNTDKSREGAKQTELMLVFSHGAIDIAGMSTDRGWTSCMNLYTGVNKRYVARDVKQGTIICYVTKTEDKNLTSPTARTLIKPYINVDDWTDVVYIPDVGEHYGVNPPDFIKTVQSIMAKVQETKIGRFTLQNSLYCDTIGKEQRRYEQPIQDILDGKTRPKTIEEVEKIMELLYIPRAFYKINNDLSVDVTGQVDIELPDLRTIPVQFNEVKGNFIILSQNIKSLIGSPRKCDTFECQGTQIETLEGGPEIVNGDFLLMWNTKLTSLKGGPKVVIDTYDVSNCNLESLDGAPDKARFFKCNHNKYLHTLQGAPERIINSFYATDCGLTSLVGGPKKVGFVYDISHNLLDSADKFEGLPMYVGNTLDVSYNHLFDEDIKKIREKLEANGTSPLINNLRSFHDTHPDWQ